MLGLLVCGFEFDLHVKMYVLFSMSGLFGSYSILSIGGSKLRFNSVNLYVKKFN